MTQNYFKAYCEAREKISNYKNMIIKNHISHYEILEELLGFQYSLSNEFAKYYQEHPDKDDLIKHHFTALSGELLFGYNIQFLQISLESLEIGYIHPAASNLRSVFEAIPKMYYMSFYPERTFPILIHEIVKEFEYEDAIKELKKVEYKKFLIDKTIPFTNNENFKKFKKKYRPSWIRKQVYDDEKILPMDEAMIDPIEDVKEYTHVRLLQSLYGTLSDSSHANLMRNKAAVDYSQVDTNFFFGLLKNMSYFNIHAFLETSIEIIGEIGRIRSSTEFLNHIAAKYKTMTPSGYLLPSNSNLSSKLKVGLKK